MAIPKINVNKQAGNLFRTVTNLDALTALVLDSAKPATFGADSTKEFFSLRQAEDAGLTSPDYPAEHYQISEFFRINPNGRLRVGFGDITSTAAFNVLRAGQPRQIGYFTKDALTTAMVAAAQARALELEAAEAPASIILGANTLGITTAALPSLAGLSDNKVSVVIGQGGAGSTAATIATSTGASVPALGTFLGRLALCNVAESAGFVQNGDISGTELQVVGLGNGTALTDLTKGEQDDLDNKNYIFLVKYANLDGSYFNGAPTASSGDYNLVELNRVIDKAIRATRRALTPKLNASIQLDAAGQISTIIVKQYENLVKNELQAMAANNEVSAYDCTISPAQNILATSNLEVSVAIVPYGTSKTITVNIGFVASLV